jgi:hypothetical protein
VSRVCARLGVPSARDGGPGRVAQVQRIDTARSREQAVGQVVGPGRAIDPAFDDASERVIRRALSAPRTSGVVSTVLVWSMVMTSSSH